MADLSCKKFSFFPSLPSRTIAVWMVCLLPLLGPILTGCSSTSKFSSMFMQAPESNMTESLGWTTSHPSAEMEASSTGKVLMLWFTGSDWCGYCTMLENEVFHKPGFQEWSEQNIVPVMVDFPRKVKLAVELEQQNKGLAERYDEYVTGYPTALFLDKQGNVIGKLGYESGGPDHWIKKANAIIARHQQPVVR